ncbi:MAG: T9SS type A sorting domain-containing protein [Bacteroidota bacterium]
MKYFFIITLMIIFPSIALAQSVRGVTDNTPRAAEVVESDAVYRVINVAPDKKAENRNSKKSDKMQTPGDDNIFGLVLKDSIAGSEIIRAGRMISGSLDKKSASISIDKIALTAAAEAAVNKSPRGLRDLLRLNFSMLDESIQNKCAAIINDAQHPYVDEIAFCIARLSPEYLKSNYFYPQLLIDNARLIYEHDAELDYVNIVDYGTSADDEYYSTVEYIREDSLGHRETIEVPANIYYWYIVHPKLSDEIPAYVDPDAMEYDIMNNNSPRTRNIRTPEDGVFWRDYLYTHTEDVPDTTGLQFSILRDLVSQADVMWSDDTDNKQTAVRQITKWIREVMEFGSEQERPHQPVRIYDLHLGRCGEHEDITNAVARACLIPCRGIGAPSQDHVWNEFWDKEWWQWEPVNNAHKKNNAYGEYGWGKKFGSVYARRSDGVVMPVTSRYTPHTANLTIRVVDASDKPIDGATVIIYMKNTTYDAILFDMYAITNAAGEAYFEVGRDNEFFAQMRSPYGSVPASSDQVVSVAENTAEDQDYTYEIKAPNSRFMPEYTEVEVPDGLENDWVFHCDAEPDFALTNWQVLMNDLGGEYVWNFSGINHMNAYVANDANLMKLKQFAPAECAFIRNDVDNLSEDFQIPSEDSWNWVLHNPMVRTAVFVNYQFKVSADPELSAEQRADIIAEAYPNPFSQTTRIEFESELGGKAQFRLISMDGRELVSEEIALSQGRNLIEFNGRDAGGNMLESGMYFYKIENARLNISGKLMLGE